MMNNRGHLPAGQPLQGGVDNMAQGPGPGLAGGGGGVVGNGGDRRPRREGRHSQHYAPQHPYHQHANQYNMYPPNYMTPYGAAPAPYYMPPQYPNGGMPSPSYMGYPPAAAYNRSPPSMQQYAPMVAHGSYGRPAQHSPIVPAPYQAPPPHAAIPPVAIPPPLTPSSTHSSYVAPPPPPPPVMTPPAAQVIESLPVDSQIPPPPQPEPELAKKVLSPASVPVQLPQSPLQPRPSPWAPMPWLSRPDEPFPTRTTRSRRRRRVLNVGVEVVQPGGPIDEKADAEVDKAEELPVEQTTSDLDKGEQETSAATPKVAASEPPVELPPDSESTSTQEQPSEGANSSSPTTPSSVQPALAQNSTTPAQKPAKVAARSTLPAIPVIPALPKATPKDAKPVVSEKTGIETGKVSEHASNEGRIDGEEAPKDIGEGSTDGNKTETTESAPAPAPAPVKPKSWSALFSKPSTTAPAVTAAVTSDHTQTNGTVAAGGSDVTVGTTGFAKTNSNLLVEALGTHRVGTANKIAFLEPRGLVNVQNTCYMNSVLQVLIFCIPFYDFLDQVSKKAVHSFKSETPLLDAMIMFMREFRVIDSAVSVDQLRRRLKPEELEQYGEQFTPEFVYEAMRKLPRFASMEHGHQQDAEEFLGFLLEGLHDECARVMRTALPSAASSSLPSPTSSKNGGAEDDDWMEVGRKQKAALTRTSGTPSLLTPIIKIFGGRLRSELKVQGLPVSVTFEPYQPLQLDIGAPDVRNIVDALKGLTRPETLHGDFNSPHGKDARATKQVFIETLPPVLVLHLKRFHFDAEGHGATKIWKKVGYPLELEIPREVFARSRRNALLGESAHKYRLIAVVYHHGTSTSNGHYTVDVRRQDGREWIRIDDTIIRRVRSEDVAEGGAEEDSSKTPASEGRKENGNINAGSNRFTSINDEDAGDEDGWKQAPGAGKKWSSVVNGASSASSTNGTKAKQIKESIKDNKVAYLLFYEQI